MPALRLEPVGAGDLPFLSMMAYEAAFWRPAAPQRPHPAPAEALQLPELAMYVRGWGRRGDRGFVASVDAEPVAAAWYRRFSAGEHGYGFVDEQTPEVSIAVAERHRGAGIGQALLSALLVQARLDGFACLSLSVEQDNPAVGLYLAVGFRKLERVGNAWTMVARLAAQGRRHHRS